ncbi:MAG TPA: hypothetical protein VHE13_08325 [Opitutus sp.]|nr:hypothetical protein [Opitutus sp.]
MASEGEGFGSATAFGTHLTLVARIGADCAVHAGAAISIMAAVLSMLFEGLRWHAARFAGAAPYLAGNVLVLRGKAAAK